ncbi:condensation domain-containing protein [Massilia sp. H-1]|nr:condensation domain-containing protein [Massilia sp. H-1]
MEAAPGRCADRAGTAYRPRPQRQSELRRLSSVQLAIPAALTAQLRALSQRHGATLFMTLLAYWSLLMARLSGQSDVVVGTPVANRQRAEVEALIGFFVNTLALRVEVDGKASVAELLEQVKASTLDAYRHQELPFEQVVEALKPARSLSYHPLFQVMLAMNNTPGGGELTLPGLTLSQLEQTRSSTHFDLKLSLADGGDAISGVLEFATDLFDRATAQRLLAQFTSVLSAMAADDSQALGLVSLLGHEERDHLLNALNATAADYPARRPDAPAVQNSRPRCSRKRPRWCSAPSA